MCNPAVIAFGHDMLTDDEIRGREVLEVGALGINGSLRPLVEARGPARYLGVDIEPGTGVDEICRAEELVARYGVEAFDLVIATELLEHVRDWRAAISNLKRVLRPGGALLLTTRSLGFPYHGYPHDYWRYDLADVRAIFADLELERLERDPTEPGVFLKARKPEAFVEADTGGLALFSVVRHKRVREVGALDLARFRLARRLGRER